MQLNNEYITVLEASKRIGRTKRAIWARIYRRKITPVKIGNLALVRLEDVR